MKPAFTLVEMLITVALVAVLVGTVLVIVNPAKLRGKARDAQRLNNLKSIQGAIELYHADNRKYPPFAGSLAIIPETGVPATQDALTNALIPNYISHLPLDPLQPSIPNSTPCNINDGTGKPNYRFNYVSDNAGSGYGTYYLLTAQAESQTSTSGYSCGNLKQWSKANCASGNPYCFGFENKSPL